MKIYEIFPSHGKDGFGERVYRFSEKDIYEILEKWEEKNEHLSEYRQFSYLLLKNNPNFYKNIEMVILRDTRKFDVDLEEISEYYNMYICTEKFKVVCEKYSIPFNFYPVILRGKTGYLVTIENLPRLYDAERIRSDNGLDWQIIKEVVKYHDYKIFTGTVLVGLYITKGMAENFKKEGIALNLKNTPQLTLGMSKEEVKKYIDDRKEEIQKEKDWVINKEKKAMEVVKWCMENVK